MFKKALVFAVAAVFILGVGCSNGSSPVSPDKDPQVTIEDFFNANNPPNDVVGEFTYTDFDGNVIATGTLGRDGDEIYVIESRDAQFDIDLTPLGIVSAWVTYKNPAGTIPSGPYAGLPYYYIGQTIDYDINIWSWAFWDIGGVLPFSYAEVTAEMHYAAFDPAGNIVVGGLLPGNPIYVWTGVITPGYSVLNDDFHIIPGTSPGLDVTTVRICAALFFGIIDIVYFDGIAGVWDPQ